MSSRIHFVSAGPGDPGLLTLKGKEVLDNSDIVFYFKPYNILFKNLLKNREIYEAFSLKFEEITALIDKAINSNKKVCFLVPGDIAIFSPYSVFLSYYKDKIEIIPGVGTLNYFASKLHYILNSHSLVHKVTIISTKILKERVGNFELKSYTDKNTVLIIFMNDIPIDKIVNELKDIYEDNAMIHIGSKLAMSEERIYSFSLKNFPYKNLNIDEKLSLIIITPYSEMQLKIKWWNKKVEEHKIKKKTSQKSL